MSEKPKDSAESWSDLDVPQQCAVVRLIAAKRGFDLTGFRFHNASLSRREGGFVARVYQLDDGADEAFVTDEEVLAALGLDNF